LLALMSVLGGCSGGTGSAIQSGGPLSSGNGVHDPIPTGSICAPGGRAWTFADQQFTNYGKVAVVLNRVVLVRPRNERLIGSYAVPGLQEIGTVPWPPRNPGLPITWKKRQPVHGYRVLPGKSFNIVLGVAAVRDSHRAVSQGILVYYRDQSVTYAARNDYGNIVSAKMHPCPS
jgi:hypothetical protein